MPEIQCKCGNKQLLVENLSIKVHFGYCKILKINRGLVFFKRPLFEGLICEGAYIRWENCITKLIGLANGWWANERKLCVTVLFLPLGAYI